MKQQFVVTHRYSFTGDSKNLTDPSQTNNYACYVFTKMQGEAIFCGHSILTEDVFVTQLANNAGNSV
jgi:hypothetical protein